jgi:hypothetical protein
MWGRAQRGRRCGRVHEEVPGPGRQHAREGLVPDPEKRFKVLLGEGSATGKRSSTPPIRWVGSSTTSWRGRRRLSPWKRSSVAEDHAQLRS